MNRPLVCMTLTGSSLEEDVNLTKKYEKYVDVVELRVDYLSEDEQLLVRRFPAMIGKPCILTIRRDIDGGRFTGGDFSRTTLFGRALSFANTDKSRNFAYVDFEEDFNIPSIQDAAQAFGVKIIRSFHDMKGPVTDIRERCIKMRRTGYEIPKIAFMPKSIADVERLFREGSQIKEFDHILCAMGPEGFPSRIFSTLSKSYLTYVSPSEVIAHTQGIGHIDPVTLQELYHFNSITEKTKLYGLLGWPLPFTFTPEIMNAGFKKYDLDSLYFPLRSSVISEALRFADYLGLNGISVESPYKEAVMYYLHEQDPEVIEVGICDTLIKRNNMWLGYNTECYAVKKAIESFTGEVKLKHKKVSIIGAGSLAKSVAWALKTLGAKVCVFNRTLEHAKMIAEKYGFKYCQLDASCVRTLSDYSDLIIQTTSLGTNSEESFSDVNDPIYFYDFKGTEMVFDTIYNQENTDLMRRASNAGCKVCNGSELIRIKSGMQFKLFTGKEL